MEVDEGVLVCRVQFLNESDPFATRPSPEPIRPSNFRFDRTLRLSQQVPALKEQLKAPLNVDTCALQLCYFNIESENQIDHGNYLDIELTLDEQWEDFDLTEFSKQNKNVVLLRTSLQARCSACLEQLQACQDRALRRALFSLKQLFQYDKELVHEFVETNGLDVLLNIGDTSATNESSNKNYILRALGQLMLYVDGMEGVRKNKRTIRWLYAQCASQMRLLIKTSLKLLLVFVEYNDGNGRILIEAVKTVDKDQGTKAWSHFMNILKEADCEQDLLLYTVTLLNKVLNTVPDQDTYYDIVDALEDQGMQECIKGHVDNNNTVPDLIEQFNIYEKVMAFEDGEESITPVIENVRTTPRRKSEDTSRVSKRKSVGGNSGRLSVGRPPSLGTVEEQKNGVPETNQSTSHELYPRKTSFSEPEPNQTGSRRRRTRRSLAEERKCLESVLNKQFSAMTSAAPVSLNNRRSRVNAVSDESTQSESSKSSTASKEAVNTIHFPSTASSRQNELSKPKDVQTPNGAGDEVDNILERKAVVAFDTNQNANKSSRINESLADRHARLREKERSMFSGAVRRRSEFRERILSHLTEHYSSDLPQQLIELVDKHITNDFIDLVPQRVESNFLSRLTRRDALVGEKSMQRESEIIDFLTKYMDENFTKKKEGQGTNINLPSSDSISIRSVDSGYMTTNEQIPTFDSSENVNGDLQDVSKLSTNDRWRELQKRKQKTENSTEEESQGSVSALAKKMGQMNVNGNRTSLDISGAVEKAKQDLASAGRKAPERTVEQPVSPPKKTEAELRWNRIEKMVMRSFKDCLKMNRMPDFDDLESNDDEDVLEEFQDDEETVDNNLPPQPPPIFPGIPAPPPLLGALPPPPAPPPMNMPPPAPPLSKNTIAKNKKTIKLHWKEIQPSETDAPASQVKKGANLKSIWENLDKEIEPVKIDQLHLEHLFETRASELKPKEIVQQKADNKKEVTVLDARRSNAINIGMTGLPPQRIIRSAIMQMDSSCLNKEAIDKILHQMLPTEEEIERITEAKRENSDRQLGSAEQFLLTLASISHLEERLTLWLFKVDYETIEAEVSEPLVDLKTGMKVLKDNKTFKCLLAVLRAIGSFLNGREVHGFLIDYLSKVNEVKDTVHKQTLLHHVTNLMLDQYPNCSDLYSEVGSVARCGKVDWSELDKKLEKMERDCKAAMANHAILLKHDGKTQLLEKLKEFLYSSAERIVAIKIVHRRVSNRFKCFLLYLGYTAHQARETSVNSVSQVIAEFALEYRTIREKVKKQREKKAAQRERNKTRGKLITDTEAFMAGGAGCDKDELMKALLLNGGSDSTPKLQRRKRQSVDRGQGRNDSESVYDTAEDADASDPLLEACVKRVTAMPTNRRQRRARARGTRKSLRRTRTGLTEEELKVVLANQQKTS